jgi:hypothetical protein
LDVDFNPELISVRAQLSMADVGSPARRVAPKTHAAVRQISLTSHLAARLRGAPPCVSPGRDWVSSTEDLAAAVDDQQHHAHQFP